MDKTILIAYSYPLIVTTFGVLVVGAVASVPLLDRLQKRLERDLRLSIEKHAEEKKIKVESEQRRAELRAEINQRLGLKHF